MKNVITITWSKVMAFFMLICGVALDWKNGGTTAFMFAVPFVSALILGKQYFDKNRTNEKP
jgi:hypothetical protein